MTNEEAYKWLVERLTRNRGFYHWEDFGNQFLFRKAKLPLDPATTEPWMENAPAGLIHLCNPVGYRTAYQNRDHMLLGESCGYVRVVNGQAKCANINGRCGAEVPEEILEHYRKATEGIPHADLTPGEE